MTLWSQLIDVARRMVREPQKAADDLLQLNLPRDVLVTGFIAVMAISVIVTEPMLAVAATVFEGDPLPPLVRAIGSILGGFAFVWLLWKMGAFLGGKGGFDQVFAIFVVLEGIFVAGITVLLVFMALIPAVAGLAGLGFVIFWIWMFSNALTRVHEFRSAWKALGIVVVSWIVMNYLGALVMDLLSGMVGGSSNV